MRGRRGPAPLALLLVLLGCVTPAAPVRVAPHLAAVPPPAAPASKLTLGIGAFRDVRSPSSRREQRPPLRAHWWGFSRRGPRKTGAALFRGDVAEGARRDAATTLVRSGAFARVLWVDADRATAVGRARRPDVDWVLVAELEDLGARRVEDATLHLGRVGWFRSHPGPPVGFAVLHYRAYDERGPVYERTIRLRHTSTDAALGRAALDALALASEALARDLYALVASDASRPLRVRPVRVLPVRVLDACRAGAFRLRAFERASRMLVREAGIRLELERLAWPLGETPAGLDRALDHLAQRKPPPGGVLVGLVEAPEDSRRGLAPPLGRRAVVRCIPGEGVSPLTLVHELGHLFGALHVRDRFSVMAPEEAFPARFFDPLNRRILAETRTRSFESPLDPDRVRKVEALYSEARRSGAPVVVRDLEGALDALRRAAQR
ncbi:MAG: hypothetical protein ACE5IL_16060 [Myxococcota bacterium]